MANGTAFPGFPTTFGEKETKRLKELEEQRRAIEEAYRVKFSKEAWARTPAPEKAVRAVTPPWLAGAVRILPGEAPTLGYGFTPEQFQERAAEVETEYKELARRQKVTELLPNIQADLVVSSLAGEPITDTSDLLSTFPELRSDFTDEEINYLARLGQTLSRSTPEQILSGEVFATEPSQLPITEQDIETFFGKGYVDPRTVYATVEFAKSLEDVTQALKEAYPSEVPEEEAQAALKERMRGYFQQRNVELGITTEKPTKQAIQEAHLKRAEEAGEVITLASDLGGMFAARKMSDGTVKVEDKILGYYDEATGQVVPVGIRGSPLVTEEEKESASKDLWDAFYLGMIEAGHKFQQAFTTTIPTAILELQKKQQKYTNPWKMSKESSIRMVESIQQEIVGLYERQQEAHDLWLEEHPELQPKPEYSQNPFEHTKLFLDPMYYAHTIVSNAPLLATALGTGVLASVLTGNPLVGAVAGAAIITPVEMQSLQDDLVANGASFESASMLATSVGTLIGAVEIVPGMIAMKAISPAFMRVFRQNLQRELSSELVKRLTARGILATATKIEVAEVLEEITQEVMHNAAVKTVNENRDIFEGLDQTAIQTAIAVLPLAAFGGGAEYVGMRSNLPPKVQGELDTSSTKMQEAGLSEEHAEAVALSQELETETGQVQVEEAMDKADEQAEDGTKRVEDKLATINTDIHETETLIEVYRSRLSKLTVPGEIAAQEQMIKRFQDKLSDLQDRKSSKQETLQRIKRAVPAIPPVELGQTGQPFTTVAYRGIKEEGVSPTDEGLVGKATYYSTSSEYASTYGQVQKADINLSNPLVVHNQAEWNELSDRTRNLRQQAVREGKDEDWVQQTLREELMAEGYDGVVIGQGIVEPGVQIAVFEPGEVVKPAIEGEGTKAVISSEPVLSGQNLSPFVMEWMEDPLLPTRRPRAIDWNEELDLIESGRKDPKMSKFIKFPDKIIAIRDAAKTALGNMQNEFNRAKESGDKEAISEVETRLKTAAKEAGLKAKALLGKGWDDLPPVDQRRLALSLLPDRSLEFKARKEFLDMEYLMEFLQELTGMPFYPLLRRIESANAAAETAKEKVMEFISKSSDFKDIRTDAVALDRVAQEINARNEAQGVEHPDGITDMETIMADAIEAVYNHYKPHVRYLRVMRTKSTIEDFKAEFPDAVESGKEMELELALKLKEEGNLDDLWAFLYDKTWGVIEHGFDPRLIADSTLKVKRKGGSLEVTRGQGRLLRRESIEYPAGKFSKNVLARLASYVEQIELQWRIEPELDVFNDYWNIVADKFSDFSEVKRGLETWVARIQNIGLGYNWADRMVRRLWRQSMAAVFLEPYMSFRNSFQAIMFHPDRTELFRLIKEHPPVALREKGHLYFDTFAAQLGGLRKDWLHVGERGFLVPDAVNRLADTLSLYGTSDNLPRMWSFLASLNKANRATNKYLQDGNVAKWLKDSGAVHLRETERNHALSLYLAHPDRTFDMGLAGLREIKGSEMANLYVAHRIADITHFKYRRSSRGLMEMGVTGSTLWNLIVFPRGYSQRLYFQAEKIRKVFSGDATWEEARSGFNDVMKLTITSLLFSQLFYAVTGRERNPWNPLNILFGWQFGGLFVGIAQDVTKFVGNIATILNPVASDDDKDFAWGEIPMAMERIPETLVPIFRRAADVAEIVVTEVTGKEVKMRHLAREMRGLLDKNYTPAALDDLDRNFWDNAKKGILGAETPDITSIEQAMKDIDDAQGKLGTMDVVGRYFTLGDFGSVVSSKTRDIPDVLVSEQEGFTPITLFYRDCETQWDELYKLPSDKRNDWRKEHVLEEAMLLFWEKYQSSVFSRGTRESEEVKALLQQWFDYYEIDRSMHREWTSWQLPVVLPPE